MDKTYKIIRFFFNKEKEIQDEGLSLEEVQAHCNNPDSRGDDWFDGYESEDEDDRE